MSFEKLLSGHWTDETLEVEIPPEWAQGRTAYGGLTAAICAEAARLTADNLPPLRSAQVAFIGPARGRVRARARILRRGKSTTFVEADLSGEEGIATRGVFVYGRQRESAVNVSDYPIPDVPGPDGLGEAPFTEHHPAFLRNFEIRPAAGGMPFMGQGAARMDWWIRHRNEAVRRSELGLLALGDVTPPAVAPLMAGPAPVSSVTWHHDFLTEDLGSEDGWYLLSTHAQAGSGGWSAQDMGIWSKDGRPICAGRQSIVVFA